MATLNYFFTNLNNIIYNYAGCTGQNICTTTPPMIDTNYITTNPQNIFPNGLDGMQISMPSNNSSESVMYFTYNNQRTYYTLNNLYLINTPITNNKIHSSYSFVISGYRNDYYNDGNNIILIIVPIMNNINDTLGGSNYSIVTTNNSDIDELINNIQPDENVYNINLNLNNFRVK
jgi:hypothetical protein